VVCYHHCRFSTNCVSTGGSFSSPCIVMEDIKFSVCVSVCLFGMHVGQRSVLDTAAHILVAIAAAVPLQKPKYAL